MSDQIIEAIRRFREDYAARFGFDVQAIGRDLRGQARPGGRTVISLPPRRVDPSAEQVAGATPNVIELPTEATGLPESAGPGG